MLVVTLAAAAWLALQPDADETQPDAPAAPRSGADGPGSATVRAAVRVAPREPTPSTTAALATAAAASWPRRWHRGADADWPEPGASARTAWSAPPPPPPPTSPAAAVAAERPVAPPFPYTLIGRWADEAVGRERTILLLAGPLRVQTVAPGDVLDGTWRVDLADGAAVTATYLPLAATQTLAQGSP